CFVGAQERLLDDVLDVVRADHPTHDPHEPGAQVSERRSDLLAALARRVPVLHLAPSSPRTGSASQAHEAASRPPNGTETGAPTGRFGRRSDAKIAWRKNARRLSLPRGAVRQRSREARLARERPHADALADLRDERPAHRAGALGAAAQLRLDLVRGGEKPPVLLASGRELR